MMAGRTPWQQIKRRHSDTPERRVVDDAYNRAMAEAQRIARAQEAGATRVEVADLPPGGADAAPARRDDLYLAALRSYVEELGGRLVLAAEFPAAGSVPTPEPAAARAGSGAPTLAVGRDRTGDPTAGDRGSWDR